MGKLEAVMSKAEQASSRNEVFISEALAEFVEGFEFKSLPESVKLRSKLLMLDAVGLAFASSRYEFAKTTVAALSEFEKGDAYAVGFSQTLGVRDAALVNGILIHGLDFDDTYFPGSIHLSASCVPASLAVAAHKASSGEDFLTAYTLGLEIGARMAAAGKGGFILAGFHSTSVLGTLASTLIAGRLMGLNAKQLTMAQGIALSMASGTMQPVQDGSWNKRMHPGWAASSGISAAMLGKHGFVGSAAAYEGKHGLYRKFLAEHFENADLGLITGQLGDRWETLRTSFKLYPACHQSHAFLNAALALKREHNLEPEEIESIQVRIASAAVTLICEPMAVRRVPHSSYAAQFSLPYQIACCFTRGRFTLEEVEAPAYTDPALLALAAKVEYEVDPLSGFPAFRSGEVIVKTKDGRKLMQRKELRPDDPPTEAEIVEKFNANVRHSMSDAQARKISHAVLDIENFSDLRMFVALLRESQHP